MSKNACWSLFRSSWERCRWCTTMDLLSDEISPTWEYRSSILSRDDLLRVIFHRICARRLCREKMVDGTAREVVHRRWQVIGWLTGMVITVDRNYLSILDVPTRDTWYVVCNLNWFDIKNTDWRIKRSRRRFFSADEKQFSSFLFFSSCGTYSSHWLPNVPLPTACSSNSSFGQNWFIYQSNTITKL